MGKTTYRRLKGSQNLRQRLLLATLSASPVLIDEIRADETLPGLRAHEVSLLRLFEMVSDDCAVEINETGKLILPQLLYPLFPIDGKMAIWVLLRLV